MPGVEKKVALVTGAGRGIGLAAARLLASRGAQVMCVARSETELAATGLDFVAADLGTLEGCEQAVDATEKSLGPVDILVCNHGLGSAHEQLLWLQSPETWRQSMSINLDGPFYLTRRVMASMVQRGFGRLVYTSSTAGLVAEHSGSAYNASKAGLLGLMRSAAQDGGAYGITANAVLPGWVKTEMADRSAQAEAHQRGVSTEQIWQERAALYQAGRVATPQEVAEMIVFLTSEESSGVSGESIRVALGSVW
ncbi:MAG: SDR family oxidoreductase [Xanthomonadales bacterium]|nr:SDR family oxidoreductase [Xanthomonadales bacterium]